MGVLSTTVGTIHKRVKEYYDCRTSVYNSEIRDLVLNTFNAKYAIEDMPSIKRLYYGLIDTIRKMGYSANLVPSNVDFIDVFESDSFVGDICILPNECS